MRSGINVLTIKNVLMNVLICKGCNLHIFIHQVSNALQKLRNQIQIKIDWVRSDCRFFSVFLFRLASYDVECNCKVIIL